MSSLSSHMLGVAATKCSALHHRSLVFLGRGSSSWLSCSDFLFVGRQGELCCGFHVNFKINCSLFSVWLNYLSNNFWNFCSGFSALLLFRLRVCLYLWLGGILCHFYNSGLNHFTVIVTLRYLFFNSPFLLWVLLAVKAEAQKLGKGANTRPKSQWKVRHVFIPFSSVVIVCFLSWGCSFW